MRLSRKLSVAALAVVALMTGCGVPAQSDPQAIPSDVMPAPLHVPSVASSPSPSPSPSETETGLPTIAPNPDTLVVWFVREDKLVAVETTLPRDSGEVAILDALAAGPDQTLVDLGVRTIALDPITGLPMATVAAIGPTVSTPPSGPPVFGPDDSLVTVQLSAAFTALPPAEQVLLLGQVVLSLTDAGASSVAFIDESGTPLAVPLPDGRLLDVPATAADFRSLVASS